MAQCKDLLFAGTDSTGMNLATIFHELAKIQWFIQSSGRKIVAATKPIQEEDLQSLPYLRRL